MFLHIDECMDVSTDEPDSSGSSRLAFRKQWLGESYALMLNLSSSWHASKICCTYMQERLCVISVPVIYGE